MAINRLSRAGFIALVVIVSCIARVPGVWAQEPPSDHQSDYLGISAGGGFTFPHTDFQNSASIASAVYGAGFHYFSLDFLAISLDAQKGLLKGGEPLGTEYNGKTGFENDFFATCLSFRFFPFALADNNASDGVLRILSFWYAGTGLGYLSNNVKANYIQSPAYGSMVRYKGSNLFTPVETGINIPLAKPGKNVVLLNVNFRVQFCFSDQVDGYVPTVAANKFNDAFSTLNAGVIYKFGL